uniref:HDC11545 n=1 Tax=Drosophila melanogaster TaxID=7227 RepID=Q6IKS5_DROME|nr:TPA_inf: HDC11545 [Drosophila melanogaster]
MDVPKMTGEDSGRMTGVWVLYGCCLRTRKWVQWRMGSVNPLDRQFCEMNLKLDNGLRSRCSVHSTICVPPRCTQKPRMQLHIVVRKYTNLEFFAHSAAVAISSSTHPNFQKRAQEGQKNFDSGATSNRRRDCTFTVCASDSAQLLSSWAPIRFRFQEVHRTKGRIKAKAERSHAKANRKPDLKDFKPKSEIQRARTSSTGQGCGTLTSVIAAAGQTSPNDRTRRDGTGHQGSDF